MNSPSENPELIRQYLLGVLTENQAQHLEERLLTSRDLREELLIVEEELIDEYLCGELSEAEQKYFATHFLQSPERQQNFRFAKVLDQYIAAAEAPLTEERPGNQVQTPSIYSMPPRLFGIKPVVVLPLMALVLVFVLGSWAFIRRQQTVNPSSALVVRLEPGLVREGGETYKLSIPANVDTVDLQLVVPANDYTRYRAVLQSSNGVSVASDDQLTGITTQGSVYISYRVPASVLKPDDYKVTVSGYSAERGYEDLTRYSFRVLQ